MHYKELFSYRTILVIGSDAKRGQTLEAKDKVMNKKYEMTVDNIRANLYHHDQNDTV